MIVIAPINSFKTLTTYECLFFLTFFFIIAIFASSITISSAIKRTANNGIETQLFFTDFHSLNQIFLGAAYSFSFSIH